MFLKSRSKNIKEIEIILFLSIKIYTMEQKYLDMVLKFYGIIQWGRNPRGLAKRQKEKSLKVKCQ